MNTATENTAEQTTNKATAAPTEGKWKSRAKKVAKWTGFAMLGAGVAAGGYYAYQHFIGGGTTSEG